MLTAVRKSLYLLKSESKLKWILVIVLAVGMTGVEALGAVSILLLLAVMADPTASLSLPIVGDLSGFESLRGGLGLTAWFAAAVALFFVFRALLSLLQLYAEHRLAQNAGARLSVRLFAGYLSMPYLLHTRRNSAELIRNALQSVQAVTMEAILPGIRVVSNAVLVLGLTAVLFYVDPIATLFALGILILLMIGLLLLLFPVLKRLGMRRQTLAMESVKILQQGLHGIREVLLFGKAGFFVREYTKRQKAMARVAYVSRVAKESPRIVIETVLVVAISGFVVVSSAGERSSQETLAVMGMFAYTSLRLVPALHRISQSLNSIRYAGPAIDDVYRDIVMTTSMDPRQEDRPPDPFCRVEGDGHEIALENVEFRYGSEQEPALSDINLTIAAGETIGIVGPTGGGKSTLIDVIGGLHAPTKGRVLVDGVDIEMHIPAWQRRLGVVPQTVFLIDGTLRENIAFGVPEREIDADRLQRVVELARLSGFVAKLEDGLDTIVGERGVRMSGGQRQRVAIARALYRDPSVLILDEGTSALDNVTEAEFVEAVAALGGDRTIISVAHRLTSVRDCNRIVLVEGGHIVDVGTYDELYLRNAFFRRSVDSN